MPELPDVEVFRRTIDDKAVGKTISDYTIHVRDLVGSSRQKLNEIRDHKINSTRRRGKYCFLEIKDFNWFVLHFGMTGTVSYYEKDDEEPEYSAFSFHFKGKGHLSILTKRKLGKIEICESPDGFAEENDIGKDALELSEDEFLKLLDKKRGGIKGALMDQSLLSGIGNIYSDEILFQSRLHPKKDLSKIDEKKRRELFRNMNEALTKAIEVHADPDKLPENYLLPVRDEGESCPYCKREVKKIKVSGRGCYICPSCQKK
ncbi:MAG: Fpg/Nei family DNA glycosylase [Bacteroidota bacterium]